MSKFNSKGADETKFNIENRIYSANQNRLKETTKNKKHFLPNGFTLSTVSLDKRKKLYIDLMKEKLNFDFKYQALDKILSLGIKAFNIENDLNFERLKSMQSLKEKINSYSPEEF